MNKIIIYQDGRIKLRNKNNVLFFGTIEELKKKESKESIEVLKKVLGNILMSLEENE